MYDLEQRMDKLCFGVQCCKLHEARPFVTWQASQETTCALIEHNTTGLIKPGGTGLASTACAGLTQLQRQMMSRDSTRHM